MLDNSTSSQGSKLNMAAGCPSPELETVPLSSPPAAPPAPAATRRRRPGVALASPMSALSRGWLRRHRPAVLLTAAALGAAVLIVLIAAVAYHVTPSSITEYELEEEQVDLEVQPGQHSADEDLAVAHLLDDGGGGPTTGSPPLEESTIASERGAQATNDSAGLRGSPRDVGRAVVMAPQDHADFGSVLRASVMKKSPSRSRRHRDGGAPSDNPRAQGSHSSYTIRGTVKHEYGHLDIEKDVAGTSQSETSDRGQGESLWKWAAVPFAPSYAIEFYEIGNSVSDAIKHAMKAHTQDAYTQQNDESSANVRNHLNSESNHLELGRLELGSSLNDTAERNKSTGELLSQTEDLSNPVMEDKLSDSSKQILSFSEKQDDNEAFTNSQSMKAEIPPSLLQKLKYSILNTVNTNPEVYVAKIPSSRKKRQVNWRPYYQGIGENDSPEDYSNEDKIDFHYGQYGRPYYWYYRQPSVRRLPYSPDVGYGVYGPKRWPLYHGPYFYPKAPIAGQARPYYPSSARHAEGTYHVKGNIPVAGNSGTDNDNGDLKAREMERAFETSVVAPVHVSPEYYSRAVESKTQEEFSNILREMSEVQVSKSRQSLPGYDLRILDNLGESNAEIPVQADLASKFSKSARANEELQPMDIVTTLPSLTTFHEAAGTEQNRALPSDVFTEKLFSADDIIGLLKLFPTNTIAKLLQSLSTKAFADVLKGLTKEDIIKIKNSISQDKFDAIKRLFSPEELDAMTRQIKAQLRSASGTNLPGEEVATEYKTEAQVISDETATNGGDSARNEDDVRPSDLPPTNGEGRDELQPADNYYSTYAPLTEAPGHADATTAVPMDLVTDGRARSFVPRRNSSLLADKLQRLGLVRQMMSTMGSPAGAAAMAQMGAQDQRVGREMDAGNPLDAWLTAPRPQPQNRDGAGQGEDGVAPAMLRALAAIADDVRWMRVHLSSNWTLAPSWRSSLMEAELEEAARDLLDHTSLTGRGVTAEDRRRLGEMPEALVKAVKSEARQVHDLSMNTIPGAEYPSGGYVTAGEATASSSYTVTNPGLQATTPKGLLPGHRKPHSLPGFAAPGAGFFFPSQTAVHPANYPLAQGAAEQKGLPVPLPLPIEASGAHVPVCIYAPGQLPPQPRLAAPQAAAYASAVAYASPQQGPQPQTQPQLSPSLPVMHHQQNVYNYFGGAPVSWAGQQQQASVSQQLAAASNGQQTPIICGWVPSSQALQQGGQLVYPYMGWRVVSQPAAGDFQQPPAREEPPADRVPGERPEPRPTPEQSGRGREQEPAEGRADTAYQTQRPGGESRPADPHYSGTSPVNSTQGAPSICKDDSPEDTSRSPGERHADPAMRRNEEGLLLPSDIHPIQGHFAPLLGGCAHGEEACADGSRCFPAHRRCDGSVQCADASDERDCGCLRRVQRDRRCDGVADCPLAEDEQGCFGCREDELSCEERCVSLARRCDGHRDCPSGADELHCALLGDPAGDNSTFLAAHGDGFLYRNLRGAWHPVCTADLDWAKRACEAEVGLLTSNPRVRFRPLSTLPRLPFLVPSAEAASSAEARELCMGGRAVSTHVECPLPACGSRVLDADEEDGEPEQAADGDAEDAEDARVVGGTRSRPHAWPWVLALYRDGSFHCGATLVHPAWALTAAHCVENYWRHFYEVQGGMLRRFSFSPHEQTARVWGVLVHPRYARRAMSSDVALLRLQPALRPGRWVRPACLPAPGWPPAGARCTVVGWGATREHGPDPDHLREVTVPVLARCNHAEDERAGELCAGVRRGGLDACQGDSGGPLLCRSPEDPRRWYVGGVVSHGEGCARPGEPGAYTRVSRFLTWITDNTEDWRLPAMRPLQQCPGMTCRLGSGTCLPAHQRCDRIVDCLNAEDEVGCEQLYQHAIEHARHATGIADLHQLKVARAHGSHLSVQAHDHTNHSAAYEHEHTHDLAKDVNVKVNYSSAREALEDKVSDISEESDQITLVVLTDAPQSVTSPMSTTTSPLSEIEEGSSLFPFNTHTLPINNMSTIYTLEPQMPLQGLIDGNFQNYKIQKTTLKQSKPEESLVSYNEKNMFADNKVISTSPMTYLPISYSHSLKEYTTKSSLGDIYDVKPTTALGDEKHSPSEGSTVTYRTSSDLVLKPSSNAQQNADLQTEYMSKWSSPTPTKQKKPASEINAQQGNQLDSIASNFTPFPVRGHVFTSGLSEPLLSTSESFLNYTLEQTVETDNKMTELYGTTKNGEISTEHDQTEIESKYSDATSSASLLNLLTLPPQSTASYTRNDLLTTKIGHTVFSLSEQERSSFYKLNTPVTILGTGPSQPSSVTSSTFENKYQETKVEEDEKAKLSTEVSDHYYAETSIHESLHTESESEQSYSLIFNFTKEVPKETASSFLSYTDLPTTINNSVSKLFSYKQTPTYNSELNTVASKINSLSTTVTEENSSSSPISAELLHVTVPTYVSYGEIPVSTRVGFYYAANTSMPSQLSESLLLNYPDFIESTTKDIDSTSEIRSTAQMLTSNHSEETTSITSKISTISLDKITSAINPLHSLKDGTYVVNMTTSSEINQELTEASILENEELPLLDQPSSDISQTFNLIVTEKPFTTEDPESVTVSSGSIESLHKKDISSDVQAVEHMHKIHNLSAAGLQALSQHFSPGDIENKSSPLGSSTTTFDGVISTSSVFKLESSGQSFDTTTDLLMSSRESKVATFNTLSSDSTLSIDYTTFSYGLGDITGNLGSGFGTSTSESNQYVVTEHQFGSTAIEDNKTTEVTQPLENISALSDNMTTLILTDNIAEVITANPTVEVESQTTSNVYNINILSDSSVASASHTTSAAITSPSSQQEEIFGLEIPPDITTIKTEFELAGGQIFICQRIHQKVPSSARCDGWPHCEDGSDEMDCSCKERLMHRNQSVLCDGFVDCKDGTDEEDCELCGLGERMCVRSESCISEKQICDHKVDCFFNEDEKDCFALITDDTYADEKYHVPLSQEGILSYRNGSVWRPLCSKYNSDAFSHATDICQYLGFSGYDKYELVTVSDTPFATRHLLVQPISTSSNHLATCEGLKVRCAPYIGSPTKAFSLPSLDHSSYAWPWLAVVYDEGKHALTAGILLTEEWLIAVPNHNFSTQLVDDGLSVLMGNPRPELNVLGPNDQTSIIDSAVDLRNHILLHLKKPLQLTKHVHPLQLPELFVTRQNKFTKSQSCILLTVDKMGKVCSVFMKLEMSCGSSNILCFKWENATVACDNAQECSGIIVCQVNGRWEPTAIYNGTCKYDGLWMLPVLDLYQLRDISDKTLSSNKPQETCDGLQCPVGPCVPLSRVCDGHEDCRAAWDETSTACSLKESLCLKPPCAKENLTSISGALVDHCVLLSHSCHEDDDLCWHPRCGCKPWEFGCHSGGGCVNKSAFCDGNWDCSDGSDERGCTCRDFLQLSRPSQICDGHRHCFDKGDERNCGCRNKESYHCRGKNKICIPNDHICDGEPDCPLKDDEESCIGIHFKNKGQKISEGRVSVRIFGAWHTVCYAKEEPPQDLARELCFQLNEVTGKEHVELVKSPPQLQPTCAAFSEVRMGHAALVLRPGPGPLIMWAANNNCTAIHISCL